MINSLNKMFSSDPMYAEKIIERLEEGHNQRVEYLTTHLTDKVLVNTASMYLYMIEVIEEPLEVTQENIEAVKADKTLIKLMYDNLLPWLIKTNIKQGNTAPETPI